MAEELWPDWTTGPLRRVLGHAEDEARERGDQQIGTVHLVLALVREPSPVDALLRSAGVEPRRWRDYINRIIGVNIGIRRMEARDEDIGRLPLGAEATRYRGPLRLAPPTESRLTEAYELGGESAGPEHLLLSLVGHTDIASGTAHWMGLTEGRVRELLSLPPVVRHYRRGPGARPAQGGPVVLLGSCHADEDIFRNIVQLASGGAPLVVPIFAASGQPDVRILDAFTDAGAHVIDPCLYSRNRAEDTTVSEQLAQADVIFLDGGVAQVLCDALTGTPALDALVAASTRGAVVVGCSAGVSVLGVGVTGEAWAAPGLPPGPFPLLGWFADFVLEPHLSPGRGIQRLRNEMCAFPGSRGIGIAHRGAVVIDRGWRRIKTLAQGFLPGNVLLDGPDLDPQPIGAVWLSLEQ